MVHSLLMPGAGDTMRTALLPLATVVTPNLDEAEQLTGIKAADEDGMLAVARAITELGPRWVLVKGGHLAGDPVDVLFDGTRTWRFAGERIETRHTHGTGCTLASAIASYLALGADVPAAVEQATRVRDGRDPRRVPARRRHRPGRPRLAPARPPRPRATARYETAA